MLKWARYISDWGMAFWIPQSRKKAQKMSLDRLRREFAPVENTRQVLITETTRMTGDFVCVAGIDIRSGAMVRPLQGDGSNWEEGKWVDGGFMVVGNILSLAPALRRSVAFPHATEDLRVKSVGVLGKSSGAELFDACIETSNDDIETIFMNRLVDFKYAPDGTICPSLGGFSVSASNLRAENSYNKPKIIYTDLRGGRHYLSVTDLETKKMEPTAGVTRLSEQLLNVGRGQVVLRLGLARGWAGANNEYNPKRCYLQLNGIIFPS